MRPASGFLLEILGGLLFVLAGMVNLAGYVVDGAFGLSLLAAGVALVFYALKRPNGILRGAGFFTVGLLVLGAVASGGFSMEAPNTSLVFSAAKALVPQHFFVVTANTGGGSIRLTYSSDPSTAYRVTFRYAEGGSFPSLTIVPKLTNSSNADVFHLNLNGAGAEIDIVLGRGYALNASLHSSAGNVEFTQEPGQQVLSLDCTTSAGNVEVSATSVPYINCRSSAGNVDATIGAYSVTGIAFLATSAGDVDLVLKADSSTGLWVRGSTTMGNLQASDVQGMTVLAQSSTQFEGQANNYTTASNQYQVTCQSSLGDVQMSFGATG
jgi:hypothetical protein